MSALAPVAALLVSVALLLMGNGLQGALLPLRAEIDAQTAIEIGILGSSYFLGFGIGCLSAARFVQRAGHIRVFAAAVALASTTALVHALISEPAIWWLLRGTTGFCFAILYTVIESWLNEKATSENRGAIFSVYTVINLTVLTLGQLMLLLGDPAQFPLFAVASILVSLSAIPLALSTSEAPAPIQSAKINLKKLYRQSPVGAAGVLAVGLANGSFWALAPIFAAGRADAASPAAAVAIFMSVVVVGGAIGQWPIGLLSDRMDRRRVLIMTALGAIAAALCMLLVADRVPHGVFIFGFFYGVFGFPINAIATAHMNDHTEPSGFVETASGLLLLYGIGAVIGPIMASIIISFTNLDALFGWILAVQTVLVLFTLYRVTRREAVADEDQGSFASALIAAQTTSPITASSGPRRRGTETGAPSD
ncbi:MFS transporter [Pacificimonas sp. WHA3]|uniref:MFS transporter n=2 Tax=Pacificimonas pallii TaxID=2827236 RepID=A0ABS6SDN7_9SPHN|nr:MFS transporter [Pacificimonas pallii]